MGHIERICRKLPGQKLLKKLLWCIPTPYLYSKTFRAYYKFLTKSQWWTKEDLYIYQFKKLQQLLDYAKNNVPYYKRLFKKHNVEPSNFKSLDDIRRIPLLTKDIIREHYEELISEKAHKLNPWVFYTGGTSGRRLKFMSSEVTEDIRRALIWRGRNWADYHFGDKALTFKRPNIESSEDQYVYSESPRDKQINLNIVSFNKESIKYIIDAIIAYKPRVLESYPSRLFFLSRHLERNSIDLPSVKVIMTTSEMLYKTQREETEKLLKGKIYDEYGQMEFVAHAAQCQKGSYHLASEVHFVESIKNNGESAQFGEIGEIVGTSLVNYTMPLIRHKTQDIAKFDSKHKCACGRDLPVIKEIIGRATDIIVTPDGAITFPHSLFEFHLLDGIEDLQIIQEEISCFRIKVIPNSAYNEKVELMLINMLKDKLRYSFNVRVELVDKIPRTLVDKYRLVVSKVFNYL